MSFFLMMQDKKSYAATITGQIMDHFGVTYNSTYNIGNNDIHSPAGFWLKVSSAQRWGLTQMFRYHASGAVNLVPPALHGTHLQSFN